MSKISHLEVSLNVATGNDAMVYNVPESVASMLEKLASKIRSQSKEDFLQHTDSAIRIFDDNGNSIGSLNVSVTVEDEDEDEDED